MFNYGFQNRTPLKVTQTPVKQTFQTGNLGKPFDKSPFDGVFRRGRVFNKHHKSHTFGNRKIFKRLENASIRAEPFYNSPFSNRKKNAVHSKKVNLNSINLDQIETQTSIHAGHIEKKKWENLAFLPTIFNKLKKQKEYKEMMGVHFTTDSIPKEDRLSGAEKIYLDKTSLDTIEGALGDMPADVSIEIRKLLNNMKQEKENKNKLLNPFFDKQEVVSSMFKSNENIRLTGVAITHTIPYHILGMVSDPKRVEFEMNDSKNTALITNLNAYLVNDGLISSSSNILDRDKFIAFINNQNKMAAFKRIYKTIVFPIKSNRPLPAPTSAQDMKVKASAIERVLVKRTRSKNSNALSNDHLKRLVIKIGVVPSRSLLGNINAILNHRFKDDGVVMNMDEFYQYVVGKIGKDPKFP